MNQERGRESEAKFSPESLERQKRRAKQGRQRAPGVCRPEPKKRNARGDVEC